MREDEWSSLIEYFSFEQEVHVFVEDENCLYCPGTVIKHKNVTFSNVPSLQ